MPKWDGVLRGKSALVTGGARRLGRASAAALAEAGADIGLVFRNSQSETQRATTELRNRFGVRVFSYRCDVTDEGNVRQTMKQVKKDLGGLDILVNNAAIYETVEFEQITLAQWDAMFATNTRGPFLVSREALGLLRRRKPSRIINMGSLGGLEAWTGHAHYCSSKAAIHMLTKVMAKALAPEIAVNCVAPGMIDLGEKAASGFMKRMAKQTPMQRNGTAADVAAAVMFFATTPSFITGQILTVDGGLPL